MHALLSLSFPILATAAAYAVLQLAEIVFRDLSSPLRKLVGPKSPSLFFGNVKQIEEDPGVTWTWRNTFGPTFQFASILKKRGIVRRVNDQLVGQGMYSVGA
ncbi:hypothetical protein K438DRAFT_1773398 [Mycena galopus ATCC 62051]|nr:hypothetical protein K438DRAFT_1773398 [Mycena galopus ATCC 62051]